MKTVQEESKKLAQECIDKIVPINSDGIGASNSSLEFAINIIKEVFEL